MRIGRTFFQRDPVSCARELIGCRLQWGERSGIVIETEAYDAAGDEACHTWFKPSARSFVAHYPEGVAYVYFNYGVHWMLNVLVKGERTGFVLLRALHPLSGIDAMQAARQRSLLKDLCSGPGKLTQALGITGKDHARDLCQEEAYTFYGSDKVWAVQTSVRIGITRSKELPWRFFGSFS